MKTYQLHVSHYFKWNILIFHSQFGYPLVKNIYHFQLLHRPSKKATFTEAIDII